MDIFEEFKNYLPLWCENNKKPMPNLDKKDKLWSAAWESFMKEELVKTWEERKNKFLDMKLLTKKAHKINNSKTNIDKLDDSFERTNETSTGWDKVKKYLS